MAVVERPDGVEIHWEERGRGPLVLIAHQVLWSYPGVYAELIADLARDHRVVTYDPRGCGASTRRGPYDTETDAGDLRAVVEAGGGEAVAFALGYGYHLAIEMLLQLMSTDPRAAVRTLLGAANPELDEDQLRERVARVWEYVSPQATLERTQAWLKDDPSERARALGPRLRILHGGPEPMYEGALRARVAELYPEAQLEELAGGPISRPDLFAARIRRVSGARA
jgi:pimeloyl-ACP methyl ester carboxylesterase